jgi:hypothetical protein
VRSSLPTGRVSPREPGQIEILPPGTAAATTLVGVGSAEYDRDD